MRVKQMFIAITGHFRRQKQNLGEIIEFELYYRFLAILLAQPIISFLFHYVRESSDKPYFNLETLKSLFQKPVVIFPLLLILIWMTLFASIEISALLMIIYNKESKKRLSFRNLLVGVGHDLLRLLKPKNIPMIFWIFFAFILTGNISTFIRPMALPGFILIGIQERVIFIIMFLVFQIWFLQLYIRRSFIFIAFFHENLDYKQALVKAKKIMKGNFIKVFFLLLINGAILTIITDFLVFSISGFSQSLIVSLQKSAILPLMLAIHRVIAGALPFFKSVIVVMGNILLLQGLYGHFAEKNNIKISSAREILPEPKYRGSLLLKRKKYIAIALLLYLIVYTFMLHDAVNQGVVLGNNSVMITGHRGNGNFNPENSMSGMNQAFLSGADYSEIDVQLSKDKVPILLHDKTFMRTAGVRKTPGEMKLEDIKKLDSGSYLDTRFKGEKVPTLDEVMKAFKGRLKLNIELKPYGGDPKELAQIVVKTIKANGFENQCIVTSLNKECLEEVRKLSPEQVIGYIDVFFRGDADSIGDYDALIVEETFVSTEFISSAHGQGRQVFVWTVNDAEKMDKLIRMDVDNIITDQVAVALARRSYFEGASITLRAVQRLMPDIWK
ncbi:MAG: hypothetical protein GXZ11_05155 [Tissierellia bacterium]|nr:hypothetical protein [Tissierellia bacterium]